MASLCVRNKCWKKALVVLCFHSNMLKNHRFYYVVAQNCWTCTGLTSIEAEQTWKTIGLIIQRTPSNRGQPPGNGVGLCISHTWLGGISKVYCFTQGSPKPLSYHCRLLTSFENRFETVKLQRGRSGNGPGQRIRALPFTFSPWRNDEEPLQTIYLGKHIMNTYTQRPV